MKPSILMVCLRDPHTSAIHKINGRQWISAGYYTSLISRGVIARDEYTIEYKRKESV